MENDKSKRREEYFIDHKELDLISEGYPKQYMQEKFNPNNYNYDTISRGSSIESIPQQTIKTTKTNNERNQINKSVKKSVVKTEIRKKEKKGRKVKILKALLIIAITTILVIAAGAKTYTHIQTENIKKDIIVQMYNNYKEKGYDTETLNMEEIINNTSPEELRNNVFGNYLLINENYNWKEQKKLLNQLVDRAKLADTFNEYLVDEGYHHKVPYSSNGEDYFLEGDTVKYENAMEAKYLNEAKEKIQNNNDQKMFDEFEKYSKGAR